MAAPSYPHASGRKVVVHPTALIESGVEIGDGTSVWDNVHIRGGAIIGENCIIGEKSYIAYGVRIGNLVKINNHVSICTGITVEDGVMIAAGVVFTNDRFPRACGGDGLLLPSGVTDDTETTIVRQGATIGARAVIGPGIEIGSFAMVGMGAVVTGDVPPHALVYGVPARIRGWVCECGRPVSKQDSHQSMCPRCEQAVAAREKGHEIQASAS